MDEKQPIQVLRGASAPKPPQPQSTRSDADGPSKVKSLNSGADQARDVSAEGAPKPETPKQAGGLGAILDASRAELDKLLAETQTIHERSWRVIYTLLEDTQLRASRAVDASLVRFEKEVQDRIGSEIAMTLQNFDVEAGARLTARLDQALATAKQRQRNIEQDLAVAVAENRKQLDQISASAADGLQQRQQGFLNDLQKESERQVGELAKNASQSRSNLQLVADKAGEEIKQRTEEAVRTFQSRVEQLWQEMVARAEQRIKEAAEASTAEMAKQARQVVDREMSEFLSSALRRFDRSSNGESSNQKP